MKNNKQTAIDNEELLNSALSEMNDEYNSFYDSVSVIFRFLSFVLFAVLLFFIVAASFIAADRFSYSNLEFITRNFALTLEENKDSARYPIRYNPDSNNQFGLFGEGLAVCGNSVLSIFSATGRQTCSEFLQYRSPVMITSDKYVFIYDEGTGEYCIFNSFSKVYSGSIDHPIKNAVISDSGYYALLSSSDEYTSVVEVYDSDFSLISRFNKNGYVSAVDISDEEILIATADTDLEDNNFKVELLKATLGSDKYDFALTLSAGMPLSVTISDDGYVAVFSDSVVCIDANGNIRGKYEFESKILYDFVISSSNVLVVFKSVGMGVEYQLACLDKYAAVLYEDIVEDTIFDIALYQSTSYVLTEKNIKCFDSYNNEVINVDSSGYGCSLLTLDNGKIYHCSDTSAVLLDKTAD